MSDLAGLSQRELAVLSGVSVRQIQLFEQRQRDINQTRAIDELR
ncbi:helix-turn-helix domain-containing protein [Mediterraneibacter faecis]|nr:helix-turn-helix domain-containing protein [Mediterraneibacter faecis]